jgi:hypothetical protein
MSKLYKRHSSSKINLKSYTRSHIPIVVFVLIFAGLGSYFVIRSFADPISNVYIAQSSTGSANGSACADAYAVSFFNSSSNWGTGSSEIGPGTTVHLCGTISTDLTAQGNGTSGSPITILFEPGATISQPVCSGACLTISNRSYITVDGGTNGIIQNTANGSALAYQDASNGIGADPCTNCTIKNVTIQNIYVHSSDTDTSGNAGDTGGIDASGSGLTIADNTIDNVRGGIYVNEDDTPTDSNLRFYGNNIYDSNYGFWFAFYNNAGGSSLGPFYVYNNHIHDHANWDTTSDTFHHDGIMVYSSGSPVTDVEGGMYIYNNRFDGTTGSDATADLFFPGTGDGSEISADSNVYIFNNVFTHTDNAPGNGVLTLHSADIRLWNNTIVDPNNNVNASLEMNYTGTFDLRNNLFDSGNIQVDDFNTSTVKLSPVPDYDFFANGGSNAFVCDGYYPSPSGFSKWQSCSGGDSHGTAYGGTFSLNSDDSLPTGSPAIGAGGNLTSTCSGQPNPGLGALCEDINGTPRPSSGAWDAGAYEHASSSSSSPPTVSISSPANGTNVGGISTINAVASASGSATITSVQFKVNGVNITGCDLTSPSSGSTYSCSWNTAGLDNGTSNSITAVATDSNANLTTSSAYSYTMLPTGCTTPLIGDLDNNCSVTGHDLAILVTNYGQSAPIHTNGDLDGDGEVAGHDLSLLLSHYGQ